MSKAKFVIGIGSQRAGSTLLHSILDECTEIFMHPVKELHYFDTLFGVRNAKILAQYSQNQLDREFDRLIDSNEHGYIGNKRYKCYLRTNWILSRRSVESVEYLDLYRPCVQGKKLIGEITPEYMILPEEGVQHMAETVGKEAPIILLSRDPVERFISAFKLLKMYGNGLAEIENFDEELRRVLDEMPGWIEQQRQLNDYESALSNYRQYFDNVCFIHYESLINNDPKTIDHLESCIGVLIDREKLKKNLSTKVNQIGETGNVNPETLNILSDMFKEETNYLESVK